MKGVYVTLARCTVTGQAGDNRSRQAPNLSSGAWQLGRVPVGTASDASSTPQHVRTYVTVVNVANDELCFFDIESAQPKTEVKEWLFTTLTYTTA